MKINWIRALPGPNIYIHRPVLVARIELENLTERETKEFPGFNERLMSLLPGLHTHHCAKGAPGGFIERLHGGTYFGHTVEHVAIELCNLAGVKVNFGKTLYADAPGSYDMIMEYRNEQVGRYLFPVAMELVQSLLDNVAYPLEEKLAEAREILSATTLGPSTQAIVDAAERRGIPWMRLDDRSLVQLGYGKYRRLIQATQTERTSTISVDIAGDKDLTKSLLSRSEISVPDGMLVHSAEEAIAAFRDMVSTGENGQQLSVAVKPLDGNQGKGISLRLTTPQQVAEAYELAAQINRTVIVEEYFQGKDYRVIVVNGKLVAASERSPANVIGDGEHTIAQLIELENNNPLRGEGHDKPLTKITVDAIVEAYLQRAGLNLSQVPEKGQRVFLRETANLSTGGTARDVTDEVHPSVARMCERAARAVGLDICGIDLVTPDITKPLPERGAGIIEVNAAPGIRMHHHPSEGKPRDVGGAIVDMLYPEGCTGRIPIVAITGTNGKTTVTRMIAHCLQATGKNIGMTTTDGIYLNGEEIAHGDMTGFNSCRTILSDPIVDMAVLETARGGIVRRSLGYDWSDVAVMTNIQEDHLGQDGIETINDLLWVKSLIAERVREGGTLILNADDERLADLPGEPRIQKVPKRIVYFSLDPENPVIQRHREALGVAYYPRDGWLVEAQGRTEHLIVQEARIPATLNGAAKFQTANVLASIAACRAMGMSREQVGRAMLTFQSGRDNHGRMNLYKVRIGHVIVDYAHNPGAFEALCGLVKAWPDRMVTGIFTAPGDRTDEVVADVARTAAECFDRLIIREDEDLRGRKPGEIADILCRVAQVEAPEKECLIIPSETEALKYALETMQEGEIVVLFYEKNTEPSLGILQRLGAEMVNTIETATTPAFA